MQISSNATKITWQIDFKPLETVKIIIVQERGLQQIAFWFIAETKTVQTQINDLRVLVYVQEQVHGVRFVTCWDLVDQK